MERINSQTILSKRRSKQKKTKISKRSCNCFGADGDMEIFWKCSNMD